LAKFKSSVDEEFDWGDGGGGAGIDKNVSS